MTKPRNIDTDKLKTEALQLRDTVAVHAGRAAVAATDLAEQGIDWVAPRAQAALETAIKRATPLVETATDKALVAADKAIDVVDRAKPKLTEARDQVVDDYLPRINRAVEEGANALRSSGSLADRAQLAREASAVALTTPTRKVRRKRRFLRALGWTAVTGAVAGTGYLLWKRSQPIEDPWAEEYWADLDAETIANDAAEAAQDAVDEAVEATEKVVEDTAEKAEEVVEDVKDAAQGK